MHLFNSVAGAIVAVAFWIFLSTCAIAGMRYEFRKRQIAMETVRAAIERGQPLEPAVVEKLLAREGGQESAGLQDFESHLQMGGIITIAVAVGVLIAAFLVGLQYPVVKLPMLAAGALAACIGAGLMLAARALGRRGSRGGSPDRMA